MAKIAVVDDSSATVSMLTSILQSAGHTVLAYTDAATVEMELKKALPDLILLDIVMPEKNGYEIIRALRRDSHTKDIPVVIVSTKSESTDIIWGKRQGAVDYITKPFTPERVLSCVAIHLKP
ncbi:MAG: response regulator [Trueperaceae bacterium]|nr:response regulator [Trueperaceae bacterium]